MSLADALDLETDGLAEQAGRLRLVRASAAMITVTAVTFAAFFAWQLMPARSAIEIDRDPFALFPAELGEWRQAGPSYRLDSAIEITLGADDYHSIALTKEGAAAPVEFFSAWYADQIRHGIHSPEVCLPGGGWEIAWLERSDLTEAMDWPVAFRINRAIIQKGASRMMVYYWFDQRGRKVAWDVAAKFWLMIDSILTGQTDGALVRLTTPILEGESEAAADARLREVLGEVTRVSPRFIPDGNITAPGGA